MKQKIKQILLKVKSMEGEDGNLLPSLHNEKDIEKFALMIIDECMNAIGKDNYTQLTGVAYCQEIKYHFGVK